LPHVLEEISEYDKEHQQGLYERDIRELCLKDRLISPVEMGCVEKSEVLL